MPISKKWSRSTRSHVESNVPESPGVYELRNFGKLQSIGHSKNLNRRVKDHLRKDPNYYRFVTCYSKRDAKRLEDNHLDRFEDSHGELPKWNRNDTRTKKTGFFGGLFG